MSREIKSPKKHEQKIKILACGQCHITNRYVLFAPVKTPEGIIAVRKEKNESFFAVRKSCGKKLVPVELH